MKAKFAGKLLLGMMILPGLWPAYAADRPLLGAEIWIEPGQTPLQIDTWFRDLADSHMPVARLFLMWPDLQSAPDKWNFTLYDAAFRAAEKYHIHIVATLTPSGLPPFLGGDGSQGGGVLPTTKDRQLAAVYIAKVVEHYRSSPALDTWLLVNEPGQAPVVNPAATVAFRKWLARQYSSVDQMNAAWGTAYKEFAAAQPPTSRQLFNRNRELDWRSFWEEYQTTQLRWIADRVRESDSSHPLHLNPAGLLSNLADVSDDLPSWRTFLDTLGCSIHPAWHFGLLNRDQYALGVSYLAIGHTDATPEQIHRAIDAGATLSKHLGNGSAGLIPRHSNVLWPQLADDRLTATLIADGHHLPNDMLKTVLRAKGIARSILVSDSVALAGMSPGHYETPVGGRVELNDKGRLSLAGTEFLAGAALPLKDGVARAMSYAGISLSESLRMATENPGRFVGGLGVLRVGAPANLIRFAVERDFSTLRIEAVMIKGRESSKE